MRNEFASTCYRCGKRCDAGAGHFERIGRTHRKKWPSMLLTAKWLTQHAECAIKWRGSDRHYIYAPTAPEIPEAA
jgi:hypothetical protein